MRIYAQLRHAREAHGRRSILARSVSEIAFNTRTSQPLAALRASKTYFPHRFIDRLYFTSSLSNQSQTSFTSSWIVGQG